MQMRLTILVSLSAVMLFLLLNATAPVHASSVGSAESERLVAELAPLNSACLDISDAECLALEQIYLQTNGTAWDNNDGWFQSPRPCEWYGVTCRTDGEGNTYIYGVNLSWNRLQGSIPTQTSDLSKLRVLDLSGNELSGSLPEEIGSMSELRILNLAENQLAGQLADSTGQLANLELLHLFENNFVGDLPLTLTALKKLRNFKFQNTHLCIPKDQELETWLDQIYYLSRPASGDCQSINDTPRPLVLIYAVLDNDLSNEWGRLVNNAEQGVRSGAFDVKLMVDARGENNSYEYTLEENYEIDCPSLVTEDFDCNRYRWRQTLRVGLENSAQRDALINFVNSALLEYPKAPYVLLSLVGHGSGWGANALPAQPKGWRELSEIITDTLGGMLWDDTTSDGITETQSLSTQALGSALREIKNKTGRTIDLLYLDACSMAMAEVAYEVRDSVDVLLASQNTKWATFPYDQLLPWVASMTNAEMLGQQWMESEKRILQSSPGHPFTYSLIDIKKISDVVASTTQLADALIPLMPTMYPQLRAVYSQTSHFDSNYNGSIDAEDSYIDLYDFAVQTKRLFASEQGVVAAAESVQTAVQSAVISTVYESGIDSSNAADTPDFAIWSQLGGISIYLPAAVDEEKRTELYTAANLDWAEQGSWDELLAEYWKSVTASVAPIEVSECPQTSECPDLNGWGSLPYTPSMQIYLPLVNR